MIIAAQLGNLEILSCANLYLIELSLQDTFETAGSIQLEGKTCNQTEVPVWSLTISVILS